MRSLNLFLLALLPLISSVQGWRGGDYWYRDPTNQNPYTQFYNYSAPAGPNAWAKCALITTVMDESGSMADEQAFLRVTALPNMTQELYSAKYDYDYVFLCSNGFGRAYHVDVNYYRHIGCSYYNKATNTLVTPRIVEWHDQGKREDGYSAIQKSILNVSYAIEGIPLTETCLTMDKNMIFVTDEVRIQYIHIIVLHCISLSHLPFAFRIEMFR